MGQFWATFAFEGFDPELWGQWRIPLLEILDTPGMTDLCSFEPFRTLLTPWFKEHDADEQQDAAEFLGWLRGQHLTDHLWGQEHWG